MNDQNLIQIANLIATMLSTATKQPKAGKLGSKSQKFPPFKGGSKAAKLTKQLKDGSESQHPDKKAQYEVSVLKGLNAKGFKNVELRSEGPNGVQTYKGWLKLGRQVMKGQKGVKGCFHYSQTEPMKVTEGDLIKAVEEHRSAKPSFTDADLHVA